MSKQVWRCCLFNLLSILLPKYFIFLECLCIYRVAALETEEEPGGEGSPVQVVVGAAPAVAGQDAEDQVGAAGQDQQDHLGGEIDPPFSLVQSFTVVKYCHDVPTPDL